MLSRCFGPQDGSWSDKRGTIGAVIWLWVLVLVVVIGAIAVVAARREQPMSEPSEDRPDRAVPTGRALTSDDLDAVRFTTALRGYRMDEVDALIDQLRADLIARESELRTTAEPGRTLPLEYRRTSDPVAQDDTAEEHTPRHQATES